MIDVKKEQNGTYTISWDENDPIENILSTWSQDDFIQAIREGCEQRKEK